MRSLPVILSTLLLACALPAGAETCLDYGGKVDLAGKLERETFPEQPNYESIAGGDKAATYYMLAMAPVCVNAGRAAAGEEAERGIDRVQLVFMGRDDQFGKLRPYLGSAVACKGVLMHQMSPHHHTRILLATSQCAPAN